MIPGSQCIINAANWGRRECGIRENFPREHLSSYKSKISDIGLGDIEKWRGVVRQVGFEWQRGSQRGVYLGTQQQQNYGGKKDACDMNCG